MPPASPYRAHPMAQRVWRAYEGMVNGAAVALFSAMVVVTTMGVFYRYVLNNALPWAEEADRYLFIWLSFVGASITMRHKAHIAVDLLLRYVSPVWRYRLVLIAQGCVLVFLGVVFWASLPVIELASEINGHMPEVVVRRGAELLNAKKKSVNGSKIFVLGLAYKRDTGDTRESPAMDVIRLFHEAGAKVSFHDPYSERMKLEDGTVRKISPLSPRNLTAADLVVIVTDHSVYDWKFVVRHARLVLDTRNATRKVRAARSKIHKL